MRAACHVTDNEQALLRGAVTGNCATLAIDIDADEKWIGPDIASFCQALQQRFTRPAQISKRPVQLMTRATFSASTFACRLAAARV